MNKRYHVEALRDMLPCLENDAQYLYQYGSLAGSADLFASLGVHDQKRLLALALIEGSEEVKAVAQRLMDRLHPQPATLAALLSQMSPDDRAEAQTYGLLTKSNRKRSQINHEDVNRILEELQAACDDMGSIQLEEAYWILIPDDYREDADWVEAMGGSDDFYSRFGSTSQVGYSPGDMEKYELITWMRDAAWVIHVHNHPVHPYNWDMVQLLPSENDLRSAFKWKSMRPELAEKMLFFVVQGSMAVEYSCGANMLVRWL